MAKTLSEEFYTKNVTKLSAIETFISFFFAENK